MNEAMLSFYNRVRVAAYPDMIAVGTGGEVYDFRKSGDLPARPAAREWRAGSGLGFVAFDQTKMLPGTLASGRYVNGWLELAGVKSVAPSGLDANLQQIGHQQSPGNTEQTAAGRQQPLSAQVVLNYSALTQGELFLIRPGGPLAPAYPALDVTAYYPLSYVARAKGRLVFEFIAPDGAWLRTLGTLTIPTAQDAPDDSAPMTITATVSGSGVPAFFLP